MLIGPDLNHPDWKSTRIFPLMVLPGALSGAELSVCQLCGSARHLDLSSEPETGGAALRSVDEISFYLWELAGRRSRVIKAASHGPAMTSAPVNHQTSDTLQMDFIWRGSSGIKTVQQRVTLTSDDLLTQLPLLTLMPSFVVGCGATPDRWASLDFWRTYTLSQHRLSRASWNIPVTLPYFSF